MYFITDLKYNELSGSYQYIHEVVDAILKTKYAGFNTIKVADDYPTLVWICPNCGFCQSEHIKNTVSLTDPGQCNCCGKYCCEIGSLYIDLDEGVIVSNNIFTGIEVICRINQ